MNYQYHLVYQTTNLVNNMFYIGVHSTNNLEDEYLGSGNYICRAIKKYGQDLFVRDILYFCCSREDAYIIEEEIVTKEFIERKDTYNICLGGFNGSILYGKYNGMYGKIHKLEARNKMKKAAKERFKNPENNPMYGKTHTEESKQKMSKRKIGKKLGPKTKNHKEKLREINIGKNNPMYGKKMINDGKNVKIILKNELKKYLDEGWILGRFKNKKKL